MNKVLLVGNLTKDPELTTTTNGISVCRFSIAVSRRYVGASGERETDFINIVVWRKQAENCKNYINQGSQVAIDGRIQTRNYEDQNGQKRYVTEVVADNVQFLDTKASREQRMENSGVNPYNLGETKEKEVNLNDIPDDPFKDFGAEIKIEENDLPF